MEPERGYGWLSAVIPADARRFRTDDAGLTDGLRAAGAEVIEVNPDVEIAPVRRLRGDAAVSIAPLGRPHISERRFLLRASRRLVRSARVRIAARRASGAVRRLGYPTVLVFTWDDHQRLRGGATRTHTDIPFREHFPERALVVGLRDPQARPLLDAVLAEAERTAGVRLQPSAPSVRTGILIAEAEQGIVRIAVGFGAHQIRNQDAALSELRAAGVTPIVGERVPWVLASGSCGLADWSLERTLRGSPASQPVSGDLLADCVDFLVALHSASSAHSPRSTPLEQAAVVVAGALPHWEQSIHALAGRLDAILADLPRGFAHGDFFHGNLLANQGRLLGVIDWDAAGPGRLPVLDLLHLRYATHAVAELDWGPRLIQELLPWAQAGGDDVVRGYCDRVGFSLDAERLEALVLAYWLDRVCSQLRNHAHRLVQPVWLERNISHVLRAVTPPTEKLARR